MKTNCEKADILIWARDEVLKEAISTILEEEGLKIHTAYDEHEMFKLLDDHQPQIAILESGLPKVFGLETHEIIRRIERFKGIKILLLYSDACNPDAAMNTISGPDDYIETDQIHELLISKIRSIIPEELLPCEARAEVQLLDIKDKDDADIVRIEIEENDIEENNTHMHREAKKLAKIIVSDISLYNKDKIEKGLTEDTFFELLRNEIEKGRTFYNSRVSPDVLTKTNYFDEALEDFIRGRRGRPPSDIENA